MKRDNTPAYSTGIRSLRVSISQAGNMISPEPTIVQISEIRPKMLVMYSHATLEQEKGVDWVARAGILTPLSEDE